ncbi:MAG: hypothetical protein MK110_02600 [Fuerstiella sp.]|nr:hypothetical protein [Fuerstiella sp.]
MNRPETFEHLFIVPAPVSEVAAFHYHHDAFLRLVPPGPRVRIHLQQPLANASIVEFTMWLGPFPIYWKAVHSEIRDTGFVDTQVAGPMKSWIHRHSFERVSDSETAVVDRIDYEHFPGWRGVRSHCLFARASLKTLFMWRTYATRTGVRMMHQQR